MKKIQKNASWLYQPASGGTPAMLVPMIAEMADLNMVVQLNESAALIWEAIDSPKTNEELISFFKAQCLDHEGVPDNLQEDLNTCLQELLEIKALVWQP